MSTLRFQDVPRVYWVYEKPRAGMPRYRHTINGKFFTVDLDEAKEAARRYSCATTDAPAFVVVVSSGLFSGPEIVYDTEAPTGPQLPFSLDTSGFHSMNTFESLPAAAMRWGVSKARARLVCAQGRIQGAVQVGRIWLVPVDAEYIRLKRWPESKKGPRPEDNKGEG